MLLIQRIDLPCHNGSVCTPSFTFPDPEIPPLPLTKQNIFKMFGKQHQNSARRASSEARGNCITNKKTGVSESRMTGQSRAVPFFNKEAFFQMSRHREQWQARKLQSEGKLRSLKRKVDNLDELVRRALLGNKKINLKSIVLFQED